MPRSPPIEPLYPCHRPLAFTLLAATLTLMTACHNAGPSPSAAPHSDEVTRAVDALEARLPELLSAHAASNATPRTTAEVASRSHLTLHRPETLVAFYRTHRDRRFLVQGGALTPIGARVLRQLQDADDEGLNPSDYQVGPIEATRARLEEMTARARAMAAAPPPLDADQRDAIDALLRTPSTQQGDPERAVMTLVTQSPQMPPFIDKLSQTLTQLADDSHSLELMLADALLSYARDMKHTNLHDAPPQDLLSQSDAAIVEARQLNLLATLAAASAAPDPEAATAAALLALRPRSPQYPRLIEALRRYRAFDASGGWQDIPLPTIRAPRRRSVVRKTKAPRTRQRGDVAMVRRRLAAEGFLSPRDAPALTASDAATPPDTSDDALMDDVWDDDFEAALLRYRRQHRLAPKPWIDYELIHAMKRPAAWRAAQIALNLQRLREDRIGDDPYYVVVNVPEFYAELWDQGERQMRFRVVVGSRKRSRDRRTGRWRFRDATPLFSDKMESVVFSPYWNVPRRIRDEILDSAADDPNYLEDHNYEVILSANGQEMIRQRPGAGNALGQVKFLFPNPHDVYMHDTPRKALFAYPMRAHSHGCIRVQDPLKLAHYIVSRERDSWTRRRVRINAASGRPTHVALRDGPAVHINYHTVIVDDDGLIHFLPDIYLHDTYAIEDAQLKP